MKAPENRSEKSIGVLCSLSTVVIWGSAFTGIAIGLRDFSPGPLALLRFLVANAILIPVALLIKTPVPNKRDLLRLGGLGACGVALYHTLLNSGQQTVHPGIASLLIATTPLFTAGFTRVLRVDESFNFFQWFGSALSFFGVLLVITDGVFSVVTMPVDSFKILAAAALSGLYFSEGKPLIDRYGALSFTCWSFALGTLPLFYFAPQLYSQFEQASLEPKLAALYIGVFPAGVAYLLWFSGISRLGSAKAVTFMYGVPVVALIVAWFFLSEVTPTTVELIGGLLVMVGVFAVNRGDKYRRLR